MNLRLFRENVKGRRAPRGRLRRFAINFDPTL